MSIVLTDELIIGEGRDRVCYRHPSDPDLCIKIPKRPEKQTRRERLYFIILKLLKKNTGHLSSYKGMVETNIGRGAIFELVKNHDNSVSSTLAEVILNRQIPRQEMNQLLDELRHYLNENAICLRDLSPNNIALQISTERKNLIIIDGVSNPGINPLAFFVPYIIRSNLKRKWKKLEKKLNKKMKIGNDNNTLPRSQEHNP